jgi:hypothetical protein
MITVLVVFYMCYHLNASSNDFLLTQHKKRWVWSSRSDIDRQIEDNEVHVSSHFSTFTPMSSVFMIDIAKPNVTRKCIIYVYRKVPTFWTVKNIGSWYKCTEAVTEAIGSLKLTVLELLALKQPSSDE